MKDLRFRQSTLVALASLILAPNVALAQLNCAEMAANGDCDTNTKLMLKNCPGHCGEVRKSSSAIVGPHDPSFYDLEAVSASGKKFSFENFEGDVTLVANVAVDCENTLHPGKMEELKHIHSVYPWGLEIVVFPYRFSGEPEDDGTCKATATLEETAQIYKGMHIMQEIDIHTHPVYKWFQDISRLPNMEDDYVTYFVVTPDGDYVEGHFGIPVAILQEKLHTHLHELDKRMKPLHATH